MDNETQRPLVPRKETDMSRWQRSPTQVVIVTLQIVIIAVFLLRGQNAEHFFDKMDAYATAIVLAILANAFMTDPKDK
jgi:hypothetical protein